MRFLAHLTLALLLGGAYTASADVLYNVTDLGTLGGDGAGAAAINDEGQIAGASYTSSGALHAFLYSNGQMSDLGTLGGDATSEATAINNAGQITGNSVSAFSETSSSAAHAFLYSNGQMTNPGTASLADSYGRGINDAGQVVGVAVTSPGNAYGFLYTQGTLGNLGTLGGSTSYANAVNNAGQVVGSAQTSPGSSVEHAFLYSNGKMIDLGTLSKLPDDHSEATAINNAGQVTGDSITSSGASHAFLYSNGQMTDLGTLPGFSYSWGEGINNEGQVVGYVGHLTHDAFLDSNGVMTDLNNLVDPNLHITLTDAPGINDLGQIVANGNNGHAYLLTPVPEPGTLALFGLGLALTGLRAWARRTLLTSRRQEQ